MDHFKKSLEIAKSIPFTYTSIVQCILQVLHSFWACFTPKVAISKRSKNGKNGPFGSYFRSTPQWGTPMATSIPFYKQKYCTTCFYLSHDHFTCFDPFCLISMTLLLSDAPPQPIPATGLFWSRLSALEIHTNVFSTHLWSFWYQIHLNQTLLSILKLQKYLQRVWWAGWFGTNWSLISGDSM